MSQKYKLPLNFFGGVDKSPASGHTTHLSSTSLKIIYIAKYTKWLF